MGRIIVVGDRNQCQPAGTMIYLTGGIQKPIEQIRVGDEVVSYSRESACFVGISRQGRKVLETAKREYNGTMFSVAAGGGHWTKATDNHKWLVRFASRSLDLNVVYLMKKGNYYRIGWCQLFNKHGNMHLGVRTRIEGADCAWILSVHNNKTDASIEESRLATEFGLPLIPFNQVNGAKHLTQEAIDRFYRSLTHTHQSRAEQCLMGFDRNIEYPFYTRNDSERQGRSTLFVTQTCNLLPEIMQLPVYNGEKAADWRPVRLEKEFGRHDDVYSLKIETHETYVADGICTHNSIYGFRGADITAIPSLVELMEGRKEHCKVFPLSVCRRCPISHIRLAQAIVPDIQWMTVANSGSDAPEGEIYQLTESKALDNMVEGDMGISRVNKVLIPAAYALIKQKKKVIIRGRDIGTGLIALIKKMKAKSVVDLLAKLNSWYERELAKIMAKEGVDDPSLVTKGANKLQAIEDKVGCIEALCDGVETLDELISNIEKIFSDFDDNGKPKNAVVLGTVHRTKGLEAYNVTIIDPEHFPHCMARKSWEVQQERNLSYVAATRAKFKLTPDGSVEEPGRLTFIGSCPSIYRAAWLRGLKKYPVDPQMNAVPACVNCGTPVDDEKNIVDRFAWCYKCNTNRMFMTDSEFGEMCKGEMEIREIEGGQM